jgi:H+/Cl- antiporter ClcA
MIKKYLRWSFLSLLAGIMAGVAATAFLITLNWVTEVREVNHWLIWGLPFGGFLIGWLYQKYDKGPFTGTHLIIEEIHNPKNVLPVLMAPLIFITSAITHLFGGSAGREGTMVQMGSSLADQLGKIFPIENEERKILLVAGAGAGFSAAIGAPWAGVLFGMEVIYVGRLRPYAIMESLIASFSAYFVTRIAGAPHVHYEKLSSSFDFKALFLVALTGIAFGLAARLFIFVTHLIERGLKSGVKYPPLRPALMGIVLSLFFYFEGSDRFEGLGLKYLLEAFNSVSHWTVPALKLVATSLTVGSGFKGGEFIPLIYIGTTLGSALSVLLSVPAQLLASVGFASVFGAASKTPMACSVMAVELFGWDVAPYAVAGCLVSYFISGRAGIYKGQR